MTLEPDWTDIESTDFAISASYSTVLRNGNADTETDVEADLTLDIGGKAKVGILGEQLAIEVESDNENLLIVTEDDVSLKEFGEWLITQHEKFERYQHREEMFVEWFNDYYDDTRRFSQDEIDELLPNPSENWSVEE